MQYANDENGKRIHIDSAKKGNDYFCPVCGGAVIPKQGEFNMWHFAHRQGIDCLDDWDYSDNDMSEWHREWQERFPEENREFIIRKDDEIHRADIRIGNYIIEFQHSPISADEVACRNDFYTSAGYKVIWVFDKMEEWESDRIQQDYANDDKFHWKYATKELSYVLPQKQHSVAIIFQLCDDWLVKVTWAIRDDETLNAKYKVFFADTDFEPDLSSERSISHLFLHRK